LKSEWGTKCDSRGPEEINVLRKLSVIRSAVDPRKTPIPKFLSPEIYPNIK